MSIKHGQITQREVLTVGQDLVSEDRENPEYDRAIVEMTTRLLGLSHDFGDDVAGAMRPVEPCCDDAPYCDRCGEARVRYRLLYVGVCDDCVLIELDTMRQEAS